MARVRLAPFVEEIHGTLNGLVFKKSPKGNIILSKCPDTSALARRCKCVQGEVEQGPEGQPNTHDKSQ